MFISVEYIKIRKAVAVAHLKVLYRRMLGQTEENHKCFHRENKVNHVNRYSYANLFNFGSLHLMKNNRQVHGLMLLHRILTRVIYLAIGDGNTEKDLQMSRF